MSVYLNGTTDTVRIVNATTLTIGTGDLSVGLWVKTPGSLPAAGAGIFWLGPGTTSATPYFGGLFRQTSTSFQGFFNPSNETSNDTYTVSADTWYWLAVTRSGGNTITVRVFDDSTSTTPLQSSTRTDCTNDYTTVDSYLLGWYDGGDDPLLMKVANFKIQTGVAWTAAQCRTEALYYGIQTAGGTNRLCWKLTDIDADTSGINEIGGAGPNFTNSGAITDAGVPVNLSEFGGSVQSGRSAQLNTTQGRPVQLRPTGINPFTFVR